MFVHLWSHWPHGGKPLPHVAHVAWQPDVHQEPPAEHMFHATSACRHAAEPRESSQVWSQLPPVVDGSSVVVPGAPEETLVAADVDVLVLPVVVVAVLAARVVLVALSLVVDEVMELAVVLLAPIPAPIHPAEPALHDEKVEIAGAKRY